MRLPMSEEEKGYEMELETLGFIFRYQKSTHQYTPKSISHSVCTFLVSLYYYLNDKLKKVCKKVALTYIQETM